MWHFPSCRMEYIFHVRQRFKVCGSFSILQEPWKKKWRVQPWFCRYGISGQCDVSCVLRFVIYSDGRFPVRFIQTGLKHFKSHRFYQYFVRMNLCGNLSCAVWSCFFSICFGNSLEADVYSVVRRLWSRDFSVCPSVTPWLE